MYVEGNPKTKKELKQWVAEGKRPRVFAPGLGEPVQNGTEYVEGPHYPKPHSWYARVQTQDGCVTKVLS